MKMLDAVRTVQPHLREGLPRHYGWVLVTGIGGFAVNQYLAARVMAARKKFHVEYPDMYSSDSKEFNCVQRSHQNYLEMAPFFYFFLAVAGLQAPRCSAACGAVYLASRVVYAHGYSTGDPRKRMRGAFGAVGMLALILNVGILSCRMIRAACRN